MTGRSPGIRATIRAAVRSGETRPGLRGRRQRVDHLVERRDVGATDRRGQGGRSSYDVADGRHGRRVVERPARRGDDDQQVLARVLLDTRGVEQVVRPPGFVRRRAVLLDGTLGVGAAGGQAREEDPDGRHEPQRDDGPSMGGTEGSDADRPGRTVGDG